MGTQFTEVYNRFLGKITDDMYVELTPQDTIRDLRNLIIDAIPGFEFPRHNLYDYTIGLIMFILLFYLCTLTTKYLYET